MVITIPIQFHLLSFSFLEYVFAIRYILQKFTFSLGLVYKYQRLIYIMKWKILHQIFFSYLFINGNTNNLNKTSSVECYVKFSIWIIRRYVSLKFNPIKTETKNIYYILISKKRKTYEKCFILIEMYGLEMYM
jgi:hypothetical protein